MEIYRGTSTFSGIAIGKIHYFHRGGFQVHQYRITNVKKELWKFHEARLRILGQQQKEPENGSGEQRLRPEQLRLLESGSFRRAVESMITSEKVSAAYAVMTTRDELAQTFRELEDPVIRARIANVIEVSGLLIARLGAETPKIDLGDEPVILVADSLSTTEIMEMDKTKLLAVVTLQGSEISHVSILAKTMAIPSIVGIRPCDEWEGMTAIVDGYTGCLYLHPERELIKECEIRRQTDMKEREELLRLRNMEDRTADGKEVAIFANIGALDDMNNALYYGAAGIGLLRTEFQYLGRDGLPEEEELFRDYKKVAETLGERTAVIRIADLGADKQAAYLEMPEETNPIMGNRGIRLSLDRKAMLCAQLRAIFRAGIYGNLAVMFPMITSEEEMDAVDAVTEEIRRELREKGIPFADVPRGIMIETPAAVMISRELAKRADFLSLGTNDLTQYTLAMDRQNPLLRDKYNDHHPAVLRMIRKVIEDGHAEKRPVYICGELAADTQLTEAFLRMGVDSLSVVPACILSVRRALRSVNLGGETGADSRDMKNADGELS